MTRSTLRVPAVMVQRLSEQLLQEDGLERVAMCAVADSGSGFVVSGCTVVPDGEMAVLEEGRCRPNLEYERSYFDECIQNTQHPLIIHSHPFAQTAWFSQLDHNLTDRHSNWIHTLYDNTELFVGVLSQDELRIDHIHPDNTRTTVDIDIVGDWTLPDDAVTPVTENPSTTTEGTAKQGDDELHDRTIRVFGEENQQRLADTSVAVVGCGGIGSLLTQHLAALNVQQVTFIDLDRLERSNVPRIPQATERDVGEHKVAVLQEAYLEQVPEAETTIVSTPVQDAEPELADVDVILAGLDRITPRVWLNQYATRHLTYYIDAGSRIDVDDTGRIEDMATYVQTIVPGTDTACFECLDRDDQEAMRRENLTATELEAEVDEGYIAGTELSPEPAVMPLNSDAATHAIDQFVRIVTGYRSPVEYRHFQATENQVTAMETHRSDRCYTCDRFLGVGESTRYGPSTRIAADGLPEPAAPDADNG